MQDAMDDEMAIEPSFEDYLRTLSDTSAVVYKRRVRDYKSVCMDSDEQFDCALPSTLNTYITFLKDEEDFAASTIWSINSAISAWFLSVHGIKVLEVVPILGRKLKQWSKTEEIKKAQTFSMEDINKLLEDAPNDSVWLQKKVAFVVGIYGFLRLGELDSVNFSDFAFKEHAIEGKVYRKENQGAKKVSTFSITDSLSRSIMETYWALFTDEERGRRDGRLFRRLTSTMKTMNQVVGRNTLSSFSKEVAKWLRKSDWEKYTSHSFRRTAATFLVESGASMPVLKVAGGWKSDSAPQGYIAESNRMRMEIATSIPIGDNEKRPEATLKAPVKSAVNGNATRPDSVPSVVHAGQHQAFAFHGATNCTFNFGMTPAHTNTQSGPSPLPVAANVDVLEMLRVLVGQAAEAKIAQNTVPAVPDKILEEQPAPKVKAIKTKAPYMQRPPSPKNLRSRRH